MLKYVHGLWTSVLVVALTGCFVEVDENRGYESENDSGWWADDHRSGLPQEVWDQGHTCRIWDDDAEYGYRWACYEQEDYVWRTSCREQDCQGVRVLAHYMLAKDLGGDHTLHLEAFDNANFSGAPVATTEITNFQAKTGEWGEADIYLSPGEYYIRAYLKNQEETRVPYEFGDMDLVANQPVGVYGALSGAEKIVVYPEYERKSAEPVHVYLDKLFEKPGSKPDTRAFLRLQLETGSGCKVPDGRDVKIELFATTDFYREPAVSMTMASAMFLVTGREGNAEFVSSSLPVGKYFLRAYVDEDGNGFWDGDELSAAYQKHQELALVTIEEKRTESLQLELSGLSCSPDSVENGGSTQ